MHPETYTAPQSAFYSCWNHAAAPPGPLAKARPMWISRSTLRSSASEPSACAVTHALWACSTIRGSLVLLDKDLRAWIPPTSTATPSSAGLRLETQRQRQRADAGRRLDSLAFRATSLSNRSVSAVRESSRRSIAIRHARRFRTNTRRAFFRVRHRSSSRSSSLRAARPSACLRCFNEPERVPPDDELRARSSKPRAKLNLLPPLNRPISRWPRRAGSGLRPGGAALLGPPAAAVAAG